MVQGLLETTSDINLTLTCTKLNLTIQQKIEKQLAYLLLPIYLIFQFLIKFQTLNSLNISKHEGNYSSILTK